jgi:hypothetical protein
MIAGSAQEKAESCEPPGCACLESYDKTFHGPLIQFFEDDALSAFRAGKVD